VEVVRVRAALTCGNSAVAQSEDTHSEHGEQPHKEQTPSKERDFRPFEIMEQRHEENRRYQDRAEKLIDAIELQDQLGADLFTIDGWLHIGERPLQSNRPHHSALGSADFRQAGVPAKTDQVTGGAIVSQQPGAVDERANG
jgi:hypothetical protein